MIEPKPGDVLSFSAGSTDLSLNRYRVLNTKDDRYEQTLHRVPLLERYLSGRTPLVISCYPASLGNFPHAVFLDTHTRPANFSRGLLLAKSCGFAAILVGQLLLTADLLLNHFRAGYPCPDSLIVVLGGYPCPVGLEQLISSTLGSRMVHHLVLHAYGVAEVGFGLLIGQRMENRVCYRPIPPDLEIKLLNGQLFLRRNGEWVDTGDTASLLVATTYEIHPSSCRSGVNILDDLNSWDEDMWRRRTGYLCAKSSGITYQLRKEAKPASELEMEFYEFAKRYGMSWLEKPNWGQSE